MLRGTCESDPGVWRTLVSGCVQSRLCCVAGKARQVVATEDQVDSKPPVRTGPLIRDETGGHACDGGWMVQIVWFA